MLHKLTVYCYSWDKEFIQVTLADATRYEDAVILGSIKVSIPEEMTNPSNIDELVFNAKIASAEKKVADKFIELQKAEQALKDLMALTYEGRTDEDH